MIGVGVGGLLGNCSRLQNSKETRRLNVTHPLQWNPRSKRKGYKGHLWENQNFEYDVYILEYYIRGLPWSSSV